MMQGLKGTWTLGFLLPLQRSGQRAARNLPKKELPLFINLEIIWASRTQHLTTIIFLLTQILPLWNLFHSQHHWLNFVNRLNLKLTNSSKIGEVTYCCCFLQRPLVSSKGFEKNVLFSYYQILIT